MADDNTIIEGTVKFRDGKKWKSRWCVMRKLSPVADCVQVQLYREARRGGGSKASLSLQRYLGCEAGFTLDKQSNTLALVCSDLVAVLAFETRERLIQWQVKVSSQLGAARGHVVLVGASPRSPRAPRPLPPGPARLHVRARRFALTAGTPPRLLGVWELAHLRRYGVVEGRFCFEGGSHCGKGEGLHVLISDQAKEIARDFDLASQGRLSPRGRPRNFNKIEGAESPISQNAYRPDTRLSDLNTIDGLLPPLERAADEPPCDDTSPCWPSTEGSHFRDLGLGDTASVCEADAEEGAWSGAGVTLERCASCMSKLGAAMSRSSTAPLTPGAGHFNPAWTMEPMPQTRRPPQRPPKPPGLELNIARKPPALQFNLTRKSPGIELNLATKPPLAPPLRICGCAGVVVVEEKPSRVGPYDNYDVPKLPSAEVDGEYYDTPKRLRESLGDEQFKMTRSSTADAIILKKPCGCLLKLGKRRREPTIVDTDENFRPANCPCRRITDWAHGWIKLPYCRRSNASSDNLAFDKENVTPDDRSALYATVDLSRKTRRKLRPCDRQEDAFDGRLLTRSMDERLVEVDNGPLANYENLSFALSLEHYENAKDLLRRAGVTQTELDAIGADLKPVSLKEGGDICTKCGHLQLRRSSEIPTAHDDYLMMEPRVGETEKSERGKLPAGYAPMSPIGAFAFHTLRQPARSPIDRLLEKSASNPALGAPDASRVDTSDVTESAERFERRKRSNSADSSRFLEDVEEFEGDRSSTSSVETLRDATRRDKRWDADGAESRPRPARAQRSASEPGRANRDSSSSNDSGVSSSAPPRARRAAPRAAPHPRPAPHPAPRRSRSSGAPRGSPAPEASAAKSASAEAEVPVLLAKPLRGAGRPAPPTEECRREALAGLSCACAGRCVADSRSTSSGASDLSDYVETLSICSSHSSDTPGAVRVACTTTGTGTGACTGTGTSTSMGRLRPRSGNEYLSLHPRAHRHYSHLH